MFLAAEYPFLELMGTMLIFFAWVAWIWIVIMVLNDIFRRHDIGGWGKAIWVVFVIIVPYLGVLVYLIAQHDGMRERAIAAQQAQQSAFDERVKAAAGDNTAEQIEKAKALHDSGAIDDEEYARLKAKALA